MKNQPVESTPGASILDTERIQRIWELRAQQLAQRETVEEPGEKIDVVVISLGDELLGIEVRYVSDIRLQEPLVRVPRTPVWVMGVTNLRGKIFSVIDLRSYIGLPPSQHTADGFFLTVQSQAMQVIFCVDDVPGVEVIQLKEVIAKGESMHHLPDGYVRAVIERHGAAGWQPYITLLDMHALLSDPRLVVHEELG